MILIVLALILLFVGGFLIGNASTHDTIDSCQSFVVSSDKIIKLELEISSVQNDQLEATGNFDTETISMKSKEISNLSKQIQDEAVIYNASKEGCIKN